jgi:hypothetical protein
LALAEFHDWKKATFDEAPLARSRQQVWKDLVGLICTEGTPLRVLEFGVARGYTTKWWWLSRFGPKVISPWSGFDRFAGSPGPRRAMPEGTFSAQGKPPLLHDPRITRYIGDIEDTLTHFDFARSNARRTL